MSKEMPVIPIDRVVDKKRIIEKNGGPRRRRVTRDRPPPPPAPPKKVDSLKTIRISNGV
jgi:hypothetical protein